jgi:hypothetical protein
VTKVKLKVVSIKTTKVDTRKWPDDFRGFGTNVRPKKQK